MPHLRDVLGELVPDTPDLAVAGLGGAAPEVLALHGAALFRVAADLSGNVSVRRDTLTGAGVAIVVSEPQDDAAPLWRWTITLPDGDAVAFETRRDETGSEGVAEAFARRTAAAAGWHL